MMQINNALENVLQKRCHSICEVGRAIALIGFPKTVN